VRLPMINFKRISSAAALCSVVCAPVLIQAQTPWWGQYGRNAQHTAQVTTGVQAMNHVLWSKAIDLFPPYSGGDLFLHYGCPLVANGGTLVMTVRSGVGNTWSPAVNTYQLEGHNPQTGAVLWTQTTDWIDPPHGWIPSCGSAIGPDNKLYTPGAGGTVYVRSSADSASATVSQICFYGLSTYQGNQSLYNSDVKICTPITVDASGNIFFGFYVTAGSTTGLSCGIARISSTGAGTWVSATAASGNPGNNEVGTNCAPAISNDGASVYVAVKAQGHGSYSNPKLLQLDSTTLGTVHSAALAGPSGTFAYILDDGTSSPMVGPDGDVYYGTWYSNIARGFMLHYSSDLQTAKTASAFGWDDTASCVPASCVPSYTGSSSYLILTKYNNYSDSGADGDGLNQLALLDPNDTETYQVTYGDHRAAPSYTTMKEILTVLGPTPNANLPGVNEWCINTAAIDVLNKSAIVNSEDGHSYRWDFTTNTLTEANNLAPPTGEAYTPTITDSDGRAYAVNNAQLFAMWDGAVPSTLTFSSNSVASGDSVTATLTLKDIVSGSSANASGPGATINLSSSNPSITVPATVTVPAGQNSVTFTVSTTQADTSYTGTISADRYGQLAAGAGVLSSTTLTATGSGLNTLSLDRGVIYGGQTGNGTVTLKNAAPTAGRVVTLSSDIASISFNTTTLNYAGGDTSHGFTFQTSARSTTVSGHITATLDDATTVTQPITAHAPLLVNLIINPGTIAGGASSAITVVTSGGTPAAGVPISMTYSAHTSGPATITAGTNNRGTGTLTTPSVSSQFVETVSASFEGTTKTFNVTINPPGTLQSFTISQSSAYMSDGINGLVTLSSAAGSNAVMSIAATSPNVATPYAACPTSVTVLSGHTSASFRIRLRPLTTTTPQTSDVTVSYQSVSIVRTITDNPITVSAFTLNPTSAHSGASVTGTITLTQPAGDLAVAVKVTSSSSLVTIPASISAAPGSNTATFTIHVNTVTTTSRIPIYAKLCGVTTTRFLVVSP
jgi:hypothetical protein